MANTTTFQKNGTVQKMAMSQSVPPGQLSVAVKKIIADAIASEHFVSFSLRHDSLEQNGPLIRENDVPLVAWEVPHDSTLIQVGPNEGKPDFLILYGVLTPEALKERLAKFDVLESLPSEFLSKLSKDKPDLLKRVVNLADNPNIHRLQIREITFSDFVSRHDESGIAVWNEMSRANSKAGVPRAKILIAISSRKA